MEHNYPIPPALPRLRRQISADDYDCPTSQSYYSCPSTNYIGCCDHDPCDTGHCLSSPSVCATLTVTETETIVQGGMYTSTYLPDDNGAGSALSTTNRIDVSSITIYEPVPQTSALDSYTTAATTGAVGSTFFTSVHGAASTVTMSKVSKTTTHASTTASLTAKAASTSTHSTTVVGAAVGSAAGLVLLLLLLMLCCLKKNKKYSFKFTRKSTEDKQAEQAISEEAQVLQEREKALRALENRGPGI